MAANRPKRPRDPNELAFQMVQLATGQRKDPQPRPKNAAAVALGRLGGLKGGKARKAKLSRERRSEIAKNAVTARWAKATEANASLSQSVALTVSRSRKVDDPVPSTRNRKV